MADVVTVIYFSFLPSRDPVPGPGQPGRSTGTAAVGWCERRTVLYDLWTCACSSRVLIDVLEELAAYPLVTLPGESAAPIRGLYRLKVQILLECWRCICPSLRRSSSRLIRSRGGPGRMALCLPSPLHSNRASTWEKEASRASLRRP